MSYDSDSWMDWIFQMGHHKGSPGLLGGVLTHRMGGGTPHVWAWFLSFDWHLSQLSFNSTLGFPGERAYVVHCFLQCWIASEAP